MFTKEMFARGIPFIIGLFGWGMVFGMVLDIFLYFYERRKIMRGV